MKQILVFLLIFLFLSSCSPSKFSPPMPESINYEKKEPYNISAYLDSLPKPETIQRSYARSHPDGTLVRVQSVDGADVFILEPSEYAKINALKELTLTYKTIILLQEDLINNHIDQLNKINEYREIERQRLILTTENYTISENAYRQEKFDRNIEKIANRVFFGSLFLGSLVLFVEVNN